MKPVILHIRVVLEITENIKLETQLVSKKF